MGFLSTSLVAQAFFDLVRLFIPIRKYREQYRYAFLVHPRDERDMIRRFHILAYVPSTLRRILQHHLWPLTVSRITGLRSQKTNELVDGYVISIPMTAREMILHRKTALKQIRRAVRLARNRGAKIVGLGALTSSLSRGGLDLIDIPHVSITTGHAYTGHTVTQTLLTQLAQHDISLENPACTIAIVGAAGSIGSLAAEILAKRGAVSLLLLDLERKMTAVQELRTKLVSRHSTLTIQCSYTMKDLEQAVGVITATNAPEALVKSAHVSSGTFIVDDAQPSDIASELYDRKDVVVLEAGAVTTPGISTNMNMGLSGKHTNYCCLAEVLILAAHKHEHNFVINRATLQDIEHIRDKGENLGFTLARPQNEHGLVMPEHLAHVAQLAKKRCRI